MGCKQIYCISDLILIIISAIHLHLLLLSFILNTVEKREKKIKNNKIDII